MKNLLTILAIIGFGILTVFFIYKKSYNINKRDNGFQRNFVNCSINVQGVTTKPKNLRNISGVSNQKIFFETDTPGILISMNWNFTNTQQISLDLSRYNKKLITTHFESFVDSPNIYIMSGNVPAIYLANINDKQMYSVDFSRLTFNQAVPISHNSVMVKGSDSLVNSHKIYLKSKIDQLDRKYTSGYSETMEGAGILNDGLMHFDSITSLIVYVNYYQNKFLCLDTNSQLVYIGKTIDTTNSHTITVGKRTIGKFTEYTSTSPAIYVNLYNCVDGGYLFNKSGIRANNEPYDQFGKYSVIDYYSLKSGKYQGSFKIPLFQNEKMRKFKILGNSLIGLYEKHIVLYKLSIPKSGNL